MTVVPFSTSPADLDAARAAFDASLEAPMWLTTVLRPAGPVDGAGTARLVRALEAASTTASLVVVDLSAVERVPREVRVALRTLEERLTATDGVLLLLEPGDEGLPQAPVPEPAAVLEP